MADLKFPKFFTYREQVVRANLWGRQFLFLNLLLSSGIGLAYFYATPDTTAFMPFFYLLVSWLGQMCFLTFAVYLVIFFPVSLIGSFRLARGTAVAAAVLGDIVLLFDVKLYLIAKVHIVPPVISIMMRDLDFYTGLNYNFMYIAVPVVVALQLLFSRIAGRSLYTQRGTAFRIGFEALAICAFLTSHGLSAWADAASYRPITSLRSVYPAHYPLTARSFLASHGWLPEKSNAGSAPSYIYPLTDITASEAKPVNIIMVFANGLSYADLTEEDTPELLKIKRTYMSFENHYLPYAAASENFFAAMFGVPVEYSEAFSEHRTYPVALEQMYRSEYLVRAVSDGEPEKSNYVFLNGALRSVNYVSTKSDEESLRAGAADAGMSEPSRPLALSVVLNDLLDQKLSGKARVRKLRSIDAAVGQFMTSLEETGRLDHTVVLITSAQGNPLRNQEERIFPHQQNHVPFIICLPRGENRGVSLQILSSHFDIAPTIGEAFLGITTSTSDYSIGEDLLAPNPRDRSFIVSSRKGDLLLIRTGSVSIYKSDGNAYFESEGTQKAVSPNLEHLIEAMRIINRFEK
jgi:membrane-anchored protein YejM (alkaline phosphatase superfamily)